MELSNNFLWVQSNKYEKYLLIALKKLFDSKVWKESSKKNIYICALLPEADFGKIKSGVFMLYLCQSILLRTFPEFQESQIRICETPEVLMQHKEQIGEVILIDDFIGSGNTAIECLEYLKFLKEESRKIYIIALVAQEEGIKNIKGTGVDVYAAIIRHRGITDTYPEKEAKEKLEKMRQISKEIVAKKTMLLGYLDTESLVAMIKTPNNTFPVYWCESRNYPYAPFPRKANIKMVRSEKYDK